MAVAGNGESIGKGVAFFDEDLVSDASTSGVEVDSILPCKGFDRCVFGKVFRGLVLNIMVEGEDELLRVMDPRCTY